MVPFLILVRFMMHKFCTVTDPNDGANPDDYVREERCDVRWRVADISIWGGTVEP